MHRRHFLQRTTRAALALPFVGSLVSTAGGARYAPAHPRLLDLLNDPEVVCAVGTAYRQAHPAEDDAHALTLLIGSDRRGRLDHQVRQEFARGQTLMLNGWILARTEARQCALYSLLYA